MADDADGYANANRLKRRRDELREHERGDAPADRGRDERRDP